MFRVVIALVAGAILLCAPAASGGPGAVDHDQLRPAGTSPPAIAPTSWASRTAASTRRAGTSPARWAASGRQPLKLVDGVWFGIGDEWLPPATKFTSGWGSTRMDFPDVDGLKVSRTDFAPDGTRGALIGLRLENPGGAAKTVNVKVDAHSEVMSHYPWAWTTPNAGDFNLPDTGSYADGALALPRHRAPRTRTPGAHDWVARGRLEPRARTAAKPAPGTGAPRARR